MKANPVMWVASNHSLQISRRKVTAYDRRCARATFHDSWEEAHAAQVEKAEARTERAGLDARKAVRQALQEARALEKARAMKKPEGA